MATSIYNIQEILETGYKIENQELVGSFLNENPFLVPLLDLVYSSVQTFFPGADLTLEVISDPEIPDYIQLFVGIISGLDLQDAFNRLRLFDYNWWHKNAPLSQNKLLIDIR